jgi:membrane protease YdiL (CAAX protease family)
VGFLLVSMFTVRLSLGASHLPLTLPGLRTNEQDTLWHRAIVLVYLMIAPMFLVELILELPTMLVFLARGNFFLGTAWILLWDLADTCLVLCVAFWVMSAAGRRMVLDKLRIPNRNFFLLALGWAGAIAAAVPAAIYLYDRAHWAAFNYGKYGPPELTNYFTAPHIWAVGAIASAVIEEAIFRGFVQPKMIEHYGLMRGIFITGIAWAAAHFRMESYPPHSDLGVVLHLILRVTMCLALSFVFGWLTLKSRSVLPAMLAHAGINFFVDSAVTFPQLPRQSTWAINTALWVVLAYMLFHYWPIESGSKSIAVIEEESAEPAI